MKRIIVPVVAAALVVAACSSGLDKATQDYCDDLAVLQTSIQTIDTLSVDSTTEEVAAIRDNISDAYIEVAMSSVELEDEFTEEVVQAQQNFDEAIEAIPEGATIGDALDDVKAAWTEYKTSIADTMSKLSCDS